MKESKSRRVLWARLNRTARRSLCAALAAAVAVGRCAPDRTVTVPWEEGEFRAVCTKNRTLFLTCPVQVLSS